MCMRARVRVRACVCVRARVSVCPCVLDGLSAHPQPGALLTLRPLLSLLTDPYRMRNLLITLLLVCAL